jgi:hypothetical protein
MESMRVPATEEGVRPRGRGYAVVPTRSAFSGVRTPRTCPLPLLAYTPLSWVGGLPFFSPCLLPLVEEEVRGGTVGSVGEPPGDWRTSMGAREGVRVFRDQGIAPLLGA